MSVDDNDQPEGSQGTEGSPGPHGESRHGDGGPRGANAAGRRRGRRRYRVKVPTREELDALPPEKRLELISQARVARHQVFTTAGLVLTVLLTAIGLYITQKTLVSTQQGQITDRYTKAVEQLGSDKREVRAAAVYALERVARDSARDRAAIRDVLAAFVREHDLPPTIKASEWIVNPDIDVDAALTVLARRPADPKDAPQLNLRVIRVPGMVFPPGARLGLANLELADLHGARLSHADLIGAHLIGAWLSNADLDEANLFHANVSGAKLRDARMSGVNLARGIMSSAVMDHVFLQEADLREADMWRTSLRGADLVLADLRKANLREVDLREARLGEANLEGVDLREARLEKASLLGVHLQGADLRGADLRGADLRGMKGVTAEVVRRTARTDASTLF